MEIKYRIPLACRASTHSFLSICSLVSLMSCGSKNKPVLSMGVSKSGTSVSSESAANSGSAASPGSAATPGQSGYPGSADLQLLSPEGGSWAVQNVMPLPPSAIISVFGRVVQSKPILTDAERFDLGEVQLAFRYSRSVRLVPMRGLPNLKYMHTLREVTYRTCKAQLLAETAGTAPAIWLGDGKNPTEESIGNIYATLTGIHTLTPAIRAHAKGALAKFQESTAAAKDTPAIRQNLLCLYVLTDPIVILR